MAVGRGVVLNCLPSAFNGRVGGGLAWLAILQMRRLQGRIWDDVEGPRRGGGGHSGRPHNRHVQHPRPHPVKD